MSNENGGTGTTLVTQNEAAGVNYIMDLVPVYAMQNAVILKEYREKLQNFQSRLNLDPPPESIEPTPDGSARTVVISHIEMTLDEMFFGEWETYDFKTHVIANEVVGSLILQVIHPVSGRAIKRTGAATIQIMVDAVPEELKYNKDDSKPEQARKKTERNMWALNLNNKKSSALDLGYPKLKAECLKNAAQSLGKIFGRDLNRKKADQYGPLQKTLQNKAQKATQATEELLKEKK